MWADGPADDTQQENTCEANCPAPGESSFGWHGTVLSQITNVSVDKGCDIGNLRWHIVLVLWSIPKHDILSSRSFAGNNLTGRDRCDHQGPLSAGSRVSG